jgi:hypothetical protein
MTPVLAYCQFTSLPRLHLRIASKLRCIRSKPTEMQSMSEDDFECLASTSVNAPERMFPNSAAIVDLTESQKDSAKAEWGKLSQVGTAPNCLAERVIIRETARRRSEHTPSLASSCTCYSFRMD